MSFTVKVIFFGLIGFVPSPERGADLAALLIDPVRAQPAAPTCIVPDHLPVVILLHGTCDRRYGKCYRGLQRSRKDASVPDLTEITRGTKRPGLVWVLHEEDLDISGDEDEPLKLRKPLIQFQTTAPKQAKQSSYFSWIPKMKDLARGRGQIREGCRLGNGACPLHGRFKIQGGETSACHLFHGELDGTPGPDREVRIFEYTVQGQGGRQPLRRVIADAAQVIFHESDDHVILRSKTLPDGERVMGAEELPIESAYLKPDEQGRLTLIVTNVPPNREKANHLGHEVCSGPHSESFFHLLADGDASPPSRKEVDTQRVNPGSCEEDLIDLDSLLLTGSREIPHAATACDGMSYPKPRQ